MLIRRFSLLLLILSLSAVSAQAQVTPEPVTLVPGKPAEREIAGSESHTYQIMLTAGQFVRFRLDQRALDAALILTAPDGKQMPEVASARQPPYERHRSRCGSRSNGNRLITGRRSRCRASGGEM